MLPFVAFTFERNRTRFAVDAAGFLDRGDIREHKGLLPPGASFAIALGGDLFSSFGVIAFGNREGCLQLVDKVLVSGDFSVTGNGIQIAIPDLPSASREME